MPKKAGFVLFKVSTCKVFYFFLKNLLLDPLIMHRNEFIQANNNSSSIYPTTKKNNDAKNLRHNDVFQ